MNAWQSWLLWTTVVAVVTSSIAEWPKRALLKSHPSWLSASQTERMRMVSPVLGGVGVIIGTPIYIATELVTTPVLAIALSACVGILSFTIYDTTVAVIRLVPRLVRKKVEDSSFTPTDTVETPKLPDEDKGHE